MNAGQRLVELSGLTSGTALAHFAAITQTGGGPGETVFAAGFTAVAQQAETRVFTRVKLEVSDSPARAPSVNIPKRATAFVFSPQPRTYVLQAGDITYVRTVAASTTVKEKLMRQTVKVKYGV